MILPPQCFSPPALSNKAVLFSLRWPLSGVGVWCNTLRNLQGLCGQMSPNTVRQKIEKKDR